MHSRRGPATRKRSPTRSSAWTGIGSKTRNPSSLVSSGFATPSGSRRQRSAEWDEDDLYTTLDKLRRIWSAVEVRLLAWTRKRRCPEDLAHVLLDTSSIFTESDMDDIARAEGGGRSGVEDL